MTFVLAHSSYGKSEIRLVKVTRDSDRHELCDVTVDVALEGDFAAVHATGGNSGLLATDTMRNTVYALAAQHDLSDPEVFGRVLVDHFVEAGPSVHRARVQLVEHPWARLADHDHAFQRAGGGERVAIVTGDGHGARVEAGIDELVLLRTTGSGFEGFLRERFTTLPETDYRILATAVSARWSYAEGGLDLLAPTLISLLSNTAGNTQNKRIVSSNQSWPSHLTVPALPSAKLQVLLNTVLDLNPPRSRLTEWLGPKPKPPSNRELPS